MANRAIISYSLAILDKTLRLLNGIMKQTRRGVRVLLLTSYGGNE